MAYQIRLPATEQGGAAQPRFRIRLPEEDPARRTIGEGEALRRGAGQLFASQADYLAKVPATPMVNADAIQSHLTGDLSTRWQDAYFDFMQPAIQQTERARDFYAIDPEQEQLQTRRMFGMDVPTGAVSMGAGSLGAALPSLLSVAGAATGPTMASRTIAAAVQQLLGRRAGETVMRSGYGMGRGVTGMLGIAQPMGAERYHDLSEAGVDPETARRAMITNMVGMHAMGTLPVALPGRLPSRAVVGGAINVPIGMGLRQAESDVLGPEYAEHAHSPTDPTSMVVDYALGSMLGGLLGPRPGARMTARKTHAREPAEPQMTAEDWIDAYRVDPEMTLAQAIDQITGVDRAPPAETAQQQRARVRGRQRDVEEALRSAEREGGVLARESLEGETPRPAVDQYGTVHRDPAELAESRERASAKRDVISDEELAMVERYLGFPPEEVRQYSGQAQRRLLRIAQEAAEREGEAAKAGPMAAEQITPETGLGQISPASRPQVPGEREPFVRSEFEDVTARRQPTKSEIGEIQPTPEAARAEQRRHALIEELQSLRQQLDQLVNSRAYDELRAKFETGRLRNEKEIKLFKQAQQQRAQLEEAIFQIQDNIYRVEEQSQLGTMEGVGRGDRPFRTQDTGQLDEQQAEFFRQRAEERHEQMRKEAEERLYERWRRREQMRQESERERRAYEQQQQDAGTRYRGARFTQEAHMGEDGLYRADQWGFVLDAEGAPIKFPDHKAAARWILTVGNRQSPRQTFELANHPSGDGLGIQVTQTRAAETAAGGQRDATQGRFLERDISPERERTGERVQREGEDRVEPAEERGRGRETGDRDRVPAAEREPAEPVRRQEAPRTAERRQLNEEVSARIDDLEMVRSLEQRDNESGWSELGGHIIRQRLPEDTDITGPTGEVIGKTSNVPNAEWWPSFVRDNPGMNPAKLRAAIRKAIDGENLTLREGRTVKWLMDDIESWRLEYQSDQAAMRDPDFRIGTERDVEFTPQEIEDILNHFDQPESRDEGTQIPRGAREDTGQTEPRTTEDAAALRAQEEVGDIAGQRREGAPEREGRETDILEPHTERDIQQREAAREEADRAERDRQRARDQREAADRAREDFELTGSPRKADATPKQKDIEDIAKNERGKFYSTPLDPELLNPIVRAIRRWANRELQGLRDGVDDLLARWNLKRPAGAKSAARIIADAGRRIGNTNNGIFAVMRGRYPGIKEIGWLKDQIGWDLGSGRLVRKPYESSVIQKTHMYLNRVLRTLGKSVNEKLEKQIGDMLSNRAPLRPGTDAGKKAIQMRRIMQQIHAYTKRSGVDVGWHPNWLPRIYDAQAIIKDADGALNAAEAEYRALGLDAETVHKAAVDWFERVIGITGSDLVHGKGLASSFTKGRKFGPEADLRMEKYLVTDLRELLMAYVHQAVRRAEFTRRFGAHGEKADAAFESMLRQGMNPEDVTILRNAFDSATGVIPSTGATTVVQVLSWVQTIGTIRLLPRAVIPSLAESMAAGIHTGNAFDGLKAFVDSYGQWTGLSKDSQMYRDMSDLLGVTGDALVQMSLTSRFGGGMRSRLQQWLLANFFRTTQLMQLTQHQWTALMKVGMTYINQLLFDVHNKTSHADMAKRALVDWGIAPEEVPAIVRMMQKDGGTPKIETLLGDSDAAELYRGAIHSFAHASTQYPMAVDQPYFSNDPRYRMAYGITRFMYSYTRNVMFATAKKLKRAGSFRDPSVTMAERANLVGAGLALSMLMATQMGISDLREKLLNPETDAERKEQERWILRLSRAMAFGAWEPLIQAILAVRYQRSLSSLLTGPQLTSYLNDISTITQTLVPVIMGEERTTNTQDWRALRSAYAGIIAPLIATALSITPAGPTMRFGYGLLLQELTAPKTSKEFATAVVGERGTPIQRPGQGPIMRQPPEREAMRQVPMREAP